MFSKKQVDFRVKNTKRKITPDLFEKCLDRDWWCVICCTTKNLDRPHHAWFWISSNLWENRNELDQVVTICMADHHKLHFEWWNNYREKCIQYLELSKSY